MEKNDKFRIAEKAIDALSTAVMPSVVQITDRIHQTVEKANECIVGIETKRLDTIASAGEPGVVKMLEVEEKGQERAFSFLEKLLAAGERLGEMAITQYASEAETRLTLAKAKLEEAVGHRLYEERKSAERRDNNKKGTKNGPFVDLTSPKD